MKGFIIYQTYKVINNQAFVYLYGRLENGKSFLTINEYKPYFYIKESDLPTAIKLEKFDYEKTNLKDFQGNNVVKIVLNIPKQVPEIRTLFKEVGIECYEADIRFPMRFLMDKNIKGSLNLEGSFDVEDTVDRIYKEPELTQTEFTPELKVLSLDIETSSDGKKLYSIALYSKNYKKVFLVLKKELKDILTFKDEPSLLNAFVQEIKTFDPDIITGWNVLNFDLKYLNEKFRKHKIEFSISKDLSKPRFRFSDNFFKASTVDIVGRQILDALDLLKASFIKVQDYKLSTVASKILGKSKLIEGVNKGLEIDRLFKESPEKLAEYNLDDTILVYQIIEKTGILDLTIKRSLLTGMELDKVSASIASLDSLYIREANQKGLVCPTSKFEERTERIKGGYVMDSIPGIYEFIINLDFKSLYPTIMMTFNIDPASFVDNPKTTENLIKSPNEAYFINQEGILPIILKRIFNERELATKRNDNLTKQALKILLVSFFGVMASPNCRFYNLKIANAITHFARFIIQLTAKKLEEKGLKVIYGDSVLGDTEIIIKNKNTITFTAIKDSFKKVSKINHGKEYYSPKGLKVLTLNQKGRSVFRHIKYIMRHKTNKKIYRIWFTNLNFIDVTEDHSLVGYLNVIHERSKFIGRRLINVKPTDLGKKVKSLVTLKKIPSTKVKSKNYPREVYELMGYFIGDGSFARNNTHKKYNKDYYLRLSTGLDEEEVLKKIIKPLIKLRYLSNYWKSKTRKGDITLYGLNLVKLIAKELRSEEHLKVIPKWLYCEREENIASFLRGLFSSDGTAIMRDNRPIVRLTTVRSDIVQDVERLLYIIGISNSSFKENNPNKYKGKISNTYSKHVVIKDILLFKQKVGFLLKRKQSRLNVLKSHPTKKTYYKHDFDLTKIKKIEIIKNKDYVYDLEVEVNHRFFANKILVHNTDSIFMGSNKKSLEEAEKQGEELKDYINDFFKNYIKKEYNRDSLLDFEFEKVFIKFFMPKLRHTEAGAKKRYAGLVIKEGKEKLEFTGLETIRSDWTPLAKKFQEELLWLIFHNEPPEKFIMSFVNDLEKGKFDDLLIYRKSIRKELEEYTRITPAHVKAARKLKTLESNKIEYVLTEDGPEPIQNLKHKIDYKHYINKQIKPIADAVLIFFNKSFDEIIKGSKQKSILNF